MVYAVFNVLSQIETRIFLPFFSVANNNQRRANMMRNHLQAVSSFFNHHSTAFFAKFPNVPYEHRKPSFRRRPCDTRI